MARIETNDPDLALVQAARSGDRRAFADLAGRHKRAVLRLAARFCNSRSDLEDLSQEAFIRAWRGLASFRGEAPFRIWLLRITANVCRDQLRKTAAERGVGVESLEIDPVDERSQEEERAREAKSLVDKALAGLRPNERLAVTLVDLEEKSLAEAAAILDSTQAAVKVLCWRARQKLKRLLEKEDV